MTNFSHGRVAEEAAAEYLEQHGFEIINRNWKTRYCEIDIVAKKKKMIYFVEVKYRLSEAQGSGFDYITDKKLHQMRFAAEFWVNERGWKGEYGLAAIEVSGADFRVGQLVTGWL